MSDWRDELVGKFVWCPDRGVAGLVSQVHQPGAYVDFNGRRVEHHVVEFESGDTVVAKDELRPDFQPMDRKMASAYRYRPI